MSAPNLSGEGGRAAVSAALSRTRSLSGRRERDEPAGKNRGAAVPSSGPPERGPAFRLPPAVGAAAESERLAETQGAPEN